MLSKTESESSENIQCRDCILLAKCLANLEFQKDNSSQPFKITMRWDGSHIKCKYFHDIVFIAGKIGFVHNKEYTTLKKFFLEQKGLI